MEPQDLPTSDTSAPGEALPASSGKRWKALKWILLIFLLLGVVGFFWWFHSAGIEETDDATLSGHIHPISARVGGTIQKVLVEENQYVEAGQLLAVIDPTDYEIALSQAEHDLTAAKAQAQAAQKSVPVAEAEARSQATSARGGLSASRAEVGSATAAVIEAQAGVNTAQQELARQIANYQQAQADYQRYSNVNPEAISAQQLDVARTTLATAETGVNAAKAQVAEAQARLKSTQATVATNVAKVTEAQGVVQGAGARQLQVGVTESQSRAQQTMIALKEDAVKQARLNLSYTRIKAPVSGRIGQKNLESGQRVQANAPLLAIVGSQIWVTANFKETQLKRMRPGQPVEIHVDAFPDHEFQGRIQSFSPATGAEFALLPPENATGNFTKIVQRVPVRILLDSRTVKGYDDLLVPGLSVIAKVNVKAQPVRLGGKS
jgi:membrane fusion protein (multidrug efflux system)